MKTHHSPREIEKLIQLVRDEPCLYDAKLPGHKDGKKVLDIWNSIAKAMGRNDVSGLDWRKKWRTQRDVYVKKRRKILMMNDKQGAERAKRWHYLGMMSFLDEHVEVSRTPIGGNPSYSEVRREEDGEDSDSATGSSSNYAFPQNQQSSSPQEIPSYNNNKSVSKIKRLYQESAEKNGIELTFEDFLHEVTNKRTRDGGDTEVSGAAFTKSAVELFFDSCSQRMKDLPLQTQSYIQLQISQLFFNAENPDVPPIPITPLPTPLSTVVTTPPVAVIPKYNDEREHAS